VLECAHQNGIAALDLYPALHEISRTDAQSYAQLWIDEGGVLGHPSAAGQAMTARLLYEHFFRQ
jgi:hypothetical protein